VPTTLPHSEAIFCESTIEHEKNVLSLEPHWVTGAAMAKLVKRAGIRNHDAFMMANVEITACGTKHED